MMEDWIITLPIVSRLNIVLKGRSHYTADLLALTLPSLLAYCVRRYTCTLSEVNFG